MDQNELLRGVEKVIDNLKSSELLSYIDPSLTPPQPFRGRGKIRLIILGQDPTVQNQGYREQIKVALLLNQQGSLRRYIEDICKGLDLEWEKNIYATNLLKNFFTVPPDSLREKKPEFFQRAADFWIPLLKKEIEEFENVPILPLGEPVLNCLTKILEKVLIRYYWGYEGPGQYSQDFSCIRPKDNVLSRVLFPFPHITGLSHKFYREQMDGYLSFMKGWIEG